MKLLLWTILISLANCVFGLQNLNFFGEYVVFTPSTKSIKFDLQKDMDVLLLENNVNASIDIDYLYRVHMVLSERNLASIDLNQTNQANQTSQPNPTNQTNRSSYSIDFTVFKENRKMLTGNYNLWNVTEKENIAIDWGSQQNVIQVQTAVNGNQHSIFSWKDRAQTATHIRHLGVRVTAEGNRAENQHSKWKLREADAMDFDIRKAYRMCDIKFLSADPNGTSSELSSPPIYEIFISREQDEKYAISMYKNSAEVAYTKTTRMDARCNVYVSWDGDIGLMALGLNDEPTPLLLWQDTNSKHDDFERIKFVKFEYGNGRQLPTVREIKNETFRTISQRYPKYFKKLPASTTPAVDEGLELLRESLMISEERNF